jgi:hypothetical protein
MTRTRSLLMVVMLLGLILSPVTASNVFATDSTASNSVTIAIKSGDATALAACLNAAEEGDWVYQKNYCQNTAYARSGDVTLENVIITALQTNDSDGDLSSATNTVDLTVTSGNAEALALCINAIKDKAWRVYQKNNCQNKAIARSGDIILRNIDILIVQDNL